MLIFILVELFLDNITYAIYRKSFFNAIKCIDIQFSIKKCVYHNYIANSKTFFIF